MNKYIFYRVVMAIAILSSAFIFIESLKSPNYRTFISFGGIVVFGLLLYKSRVLK